MIRLPDSPETQTFLELVHAALLQDAASEATPNDAEICLRVVRHHALVGITSRVFGGGAAIRPGRLASEDARQVDRAVLRSQRTQPAT